MLNSYSESYSSSKSSADVKISNFGNTINLSPITRTNEKTFFKKVNIDSQEFDLIVSEIPRIINNNIIVSSLDHCYYYSVQEIQVLSFNPIKQDTMLIEYLPIGEKQQDSMTVWNLYITREEILKKIYDKLLTMSD